MHLLRGDDPAIARVQDRRPPRWHRGRGGRARAVGCRPRGTAAQRDDAHEKAGEDRRPAAVHLLILPRTTRLYERMRSFDQRLRPLHGDARRRVADRCARVEGEHTVWSQRTGHSGKRSRHRRLVAQIVQNVTDPYHRLSPRERVVGQDELAKLDVGHRPSSTIEHGWGRVGTARNPSCGYHMRIRPLRQLVHRPARPAVRSSWTKSTILTLRPGPARISPTILGPRRRVRLPAGMEGLVARGLGRPLST
jgi:hypothetical protein